MRRQKAKGNFRWRAAVEPLERRQLLTASPEDGHADHDHDHDHDVAIHFDAEGRAYCALPVVTKEEAALAPPAPVLVTTPFPLNTTFQLHSRPGATKKIYLDFTGHVTQGTPWEDSRTKSTRIVSPAYDADGLAGFSDQERRNIQDIWQRVAEDFSPFDVDVTTEEPPVADLMNTGGGDQRYGIRVVIGGDNRWLGAAAGGVAYLYSFTWSTDVPCFVFPENLGNGSPKFCAEAISHEVGHTLGLTHDGEFPEQDFKSYYEGHGSGATGWAPIMGVGYGKELVQFSSGEYATANNFQDDLAVITAANGFGYRPDDFGSTFDAAFQLDPFNGQVSTDGKKITYTQQGVVERRDDVDYFSFATHGALDLTISPAIVSPNLDILAKLWDAGGNLIQVSNPIYALDASFQLTVPAGGYFLSIEGTGQVDALGGYSDYGSLGQYSFVLTVDPTTSQGPSVTVSDVSPVVEGNSGTQGVEFVVTLDQASARTVRVSYGTVNGTATAGNDYQAVAGVLSFAPGETEKRIVVPVIGDQIGENDESFSLKLSSPLNAVIAADVGACVILNDDPTTILVSDATVVEGDTQDVMMVFTVSLSLAASVPVRVSYATANGTAIAGSDYASASGVVVFAPGETSKTIAVAVKPDTLGEPTETFSLQFSSPENATLDRSAAVGSIRDTDAPSVRVSGGQVVEGGLTSRAQARFVVSLTSASSTTVTVQYTTVAETATASGDFLPKSGTVVFRPNMTEVAVLVPVVGDSRAEADETFSLRVSNATRATIDAANASGRFVIVDDDRREFSVAGPATAVTEGQPAFFTVTLSEPSAFATSVRYATSDSTAQYTKKDYDYTGGTVVFQPGETTKTVSVQTRLDTVAEPGGERFSLRLSAGSGAAVSGPRGAAFATIVDPVTSPTRSLVTETRTVNSAGAAPKVVVAAALARPAAERSGASVPGGKAFAAVREARRSIGAVRVPVAAFAAIEPTQASQAGTRDNAGIRRLRQAAGQHVIAGKILPSVQTRLVGRSATT
jgi:hypothetical protein